MIENTTQLAAALIQMESFADTLEGMRRHALETEGSVFATTSSGFVAMLRERIAEARVYVQAMPDVSMPNKNGSTQEIRVIPNATEELRV